MFLITQQIDACCEGSLTPAGISCVAIVMIFSVHQGGGISASGTVNRSPKKNHKCAHLCNFNLMSSGVVAWW